MKKYFYTYLIYLTNKSSSLYGHIYYGKHSTNNLFDNYIGSGKIATDEMSGIRHYMISEIEPNINFNIKEFKDLANKYIDIVYENGKIPILVGGSGFYIHAVLYDNDFLYEDYEGSIFGQMEKILKRDYEPKRIE